MRRAVTQEDTMKYPLGVIGIVVGIASTGIGGAVAAPRAIFSIVNYGSGLCLEPNGSGLGEPVLQQPVTVRTRPSAGCSAPPPLLSTRSQIKDSPPAWTCGTVEMQTGPLSSSGAAIYRPTQ